MDWGGYGIRKTLPDWNTAYVPKKVSTLLHTVFVMESAESRRLEDFQF
jgi:hypothetical protein